MSARSPASAGGQGTVFPTDVRQGLVVEELVVHRQGAPVVRGVSLMVERGELVALLGANGAGKSSLLLAISGVLPSVGGRVVVDRTDLTGAAPEVRAHHVTHVPEGRHLFPMQSVRENLLLGASGSSRSAGTERLEHVYATFPKLLPLRDRPAAHLSGGEQQMVALGRGMMSGAEVIMIDELSLGLAPKVASEFARSLGVLRDRGYAVLLVEQYVSLALTVADRAMVLNRGTIVRTGAAHEFVDRGDLQRSYLGNEPAAALKRAEAVPGPTGEGHVSTTVRRDSDGTAGPERRALLVALAGAVLSVLSFALPWFAYTTGTGASGDLFVWDVPLSALYVAAASAALAAGLVAHRHSRGRLTLQGWGVLATASTIFVVAVAVRTWMFNAGLGGGDSYSRSWGLLVALHGAALMCVGLLAAARLRWRRRSAS